MAAAAAAVAGVVLSIAVNFVVIDPELRVYEARSLTENEALQRLSDLQASRAQMVLGAAVVAGLVLTWLRVRATELQAQAAMRGAATERFGRAIDQVASRRRAVRIGGLHSLEMIARESLDEARLVEAILRAFVEDELRRAASSSSPAARSRTCGSWSVR